MKTTKELKELINEVSNETVYTGLITPEEILDDIETVIIIKSTVQDKSHVVYKSHHEIAPKRIRKNSKQCLQCKYYVIKALEDAGYEVKDLSEKYLKLYIKW